MAEFKYHKQETKYTCGAAAFRMALAHCGIEKSEMQAVKLLGTNKVRGTWHRNFPAAAEKFRLCHASMRNASLDDLKEFQKKWFAVIICYFYPPQKVDHYSVLKRIDRNFIYFYDPFFGESHKYSLNYFMKVWKSDPRYDNEKRWFFAVKKS